MVAGGLALAGCSGVSDSRVVPADSVPVEAHKKAHDPTAIRVAAPSKSLRMEPDWTPPKATRSRVARSVTRVARPTQFGVATKSVSDHASDAEIGAVRRFVEPLRPVAGTSTANETTALASALNAEANDERRIEPFEKFLDGFPHSRWAPALHVNLGHISFETGYFQDAMDHWKSAWELAKEGEDEVSKDLANLGLAEYAKMNARLGRMGELETLIGYAESRTLMGDARVKSRGRRKACGACCTARRSRSCAVPMRWRTSRCS